MSFSNIGARNSTIKAEIQELLNNIIEERTEYQENKIIQELLYECINDGEQNATLVNKVNNIFMDSEILKSNEVAPGKSLLVNSILPNDTCLEPDEGEILNNEVERKLKNKEKEIIEELSRLGLELQSESVKNDLCTLENNQTKTFMDLNCVLEDKQRSYIECLEKLLGFYEEILKLKFETFPDVINKRVELLQTETDTMKLKAELLNVKTKMTIFTETTRSLQAYNEILKDIQQEQAECKEEVDKLTKLKEQYEKVSSKQYNEILEKYLDYKKKLNAKN